MLDKIAFLFYFLFLFYENAKIKKKNDKLKYENQMF